MTDRELMQMALDVLEDINQCSLPPTGVLLPAEIDHVMEALRARLAQPEPEVDVCCQDFRNCLRSCTPRGQWIAHVRCGCGDQIMPDDGAECGTCVTARNAVKSEWQGLTNEEIDWLWGLAFKANLQNIPRHFARMVEEKLKEKNSD